MQWSWDERSETPAGALGAHFVRPRPPHDEFRDPPLHQHHGRAARDVDVLPGAGVPARPRLPVGLLWRSLPEDWLAHVRALDAVTVHLDRRMVAPETVAALASAGLPALAYTVNEAATARSLFDMGVTAVFSDAPDVVSRAAPTSG